MGHDGGKSQFRGFGRHPFAFSGLACIGLVVLVALAGLGVLIGQGITGASTTPPVVKAPPDISTPEGMLSQVQEGAGAVNQFNDKVPPLFKTVFGGERIEGHIQLASGKEVVVGVVTKKAKVISVAPGALKDATIVAYTDEATIRQIMAAQDKVAASNAALKSGAVRYEAKTLTGRAKYGILARVLRFFGSPSS